MESLLRRLSRVLKVKAVGYLRNADSGWTTSSKESLKLLLDAHFSLNRSTEEVPLGSFRKAYRLFESSG